MTSRTTFLTVAICLLLFAVGRSITRAAELESALAGRAHSPYSIVAAFYVNWYPGSLESLKRHADHINCLIPEWYALGADGKSFINRFNPSGADTQVRDLASSHRIAVIPLIHNVDKGEFQWERLRLLLSDPDAQKSLAVDLRNELQANGFAGINIDFEPDYDQVPPKDRQKAVSLVHDGLPAFIGVLKSVFAPAHLLVTQDIFANPDSFDYAALGRANDLVIVMLYDQHVQSGIPGPIASQEWLQRVARDLFARVPGPKVILGLGNYCYVWPVRTDSTGNIVRNLYKDPVVVGPGRKILLGDALECANASQAPAAMDPAELNPYFIYSDQQRNDRLIYLLDAATAYNQVMSLAKYRPAGGALWYLGSEDPSIWSFFAVRKLGRKVGASAFADVTDCPRIIYGTRASPALTRKVEIGGDGLVKSESYTKTPGPR